MKTVISSHMYDFHLSSQSSLIPVGDCIRMGSVIFIFISFIIICSGEADVWMLSGGRNGAKERVKILIPIKENVLCKKPLSC